MLVVLVRDNRVFSEDNRMICWYVDLEKLVGENVLFWLLGK